MKRIHHDEIQAGTIVYDEYGPETLVVQHVNISEKSTTMSALRVEPNADGVMTTVARVFFAEDTGLWLLS